MIKKDNIKTINVAGPKQKKLNKEKGKKL